MVSSWESLGLDRMVHTQNTRKTRIIQFSKRVVKMLQNWIAVMFAQPKLCP